MKEHPNFYENFAEASMRLRSTIVLYDGHPYHVLSIGDHYPDGIFRVYLSPVDMNESPDTDKAFPPSDNGQVIDEWLKAHPKSPILRKMMNSPLFNRFRPFPLGMLNYVNGHTYYLARQPVRNREQGLTRAMVTETLVSTHMNIDRQLLERGRLAAPTVDFFCKAFADCVKARHPTAKEALAGLLDETNANTACAFDRDFAFVRGPLGLIFLAYKTDIVGMLPTNTLSTLKLGTAHKHVKEVVENLSVFNTITF